MRARGIAVLHLVTPLVMLTVAACNGKDPGAQSGIGGAASSTTTSTGSGGAGGADNGPPPGNAVLLPGDVVMPLYPVTAADATTRAIGFLQNGTHVEARDERGALLWDRDLGPGALFGGFDFDADGFPDLGLVRSQDTGKPCGAETILLTSLDVAEGRSGDAFPLVPPEESLCWNFNGTVYPTPQWTDLDVLFGKGSSVLATSAYYATEGALRAWNGKGFSVLGTYQYPSTAAYDAAYTAARPNAYGQGHDYVANAHVANGLIAASGGEDRLLFFTSSRFVAYRVGAFAPDQLALDIPYLTGNRTDIAGRDYGLVMEDPGAPAHLVLVSGTSADTVFSDMMQAKMVSDPWGQIERHVSIVDLGAGTVDDRFFSYAHDGGDAFKYEGRVVYPDSPFARLGPGQASRLVFNVYEGGHWRVHVTAPGTTADAVVLADLFVWDIRDLDGDGRDEWVLSPSRDPSDPDVPGYYFVKWRTKLARWDEATASLVEEASVEGAIPLMKPTFRQPLKSTSRSFLYPALTAREGKDMTLLLAGPGEALVKHVLP